MVSRLWSSTADFDEVQLLKRLLNTCPLSSVANQPSEAVIALMNAGPKYERLPCVPVVGIKDGAKAALKLKTDYKKAVTQLACHPRAAILFIAYADGVIRAHEFQTFGVRYTVQGRWRAGMIVFSRLTPGREASRSLESKIHVQLSELPPVMLCSADQRIRKEPAGHSYCFHCTGA